MNETILFILTGYALFTYWAMFGWAISVNSKIKKQKYKINFLGFFVMAFVILLAPISFSVFFFDATDISPTSQLGKKAFDKVVE